MKYQSSLFLLLLLITCFALGLNAQGNTSYKPTVVPPPPDVASLGKYGDIPISMYTGIPNISIPIYQLKGRELTVPISLSYHASGVKVEEIASRVGLGWSLMAGGSISRTVRGIPDDAQNGGGLLDDYTDQEISTLGQTNPLSARQLILDQQNDGIIDLEPDLFHFNANGLSGKIFLDRDNNIGYPIPYQKLKIAYDRDVTTGKIDRFTMTSVDGTKYVFGRSSLDISRIAIDKQEVIPSTDSPILNYYTTTWHLTEIISSNGEAIIFLYVPYFADYCQKASRIEYTTMAGSCPLIDLPTNNTITIEGMVLSEIQTLRESASFITSVADRLDLPNSLSLPSDKALEKIEIRNLDGNQIKGFDLEYSYFSSTVTSNYCDFSDFSPLGYRLKLDKVTELDENDAPSPSSYVLAYETGISLPDRFSDAQDHWGYYNGKTSNTTLIPEHLISADPLEPVSSAPGGNRSPDPASMKAGILTEIKYPTGGSSIFTYEAHDAYHEDFQYEVDGGSNISVAKVVGADANIPGTGGIILDEFTISGISQGGGQIVKVSRWIDQLGGSCTYDDDDQFDECYVNLSIRKKGGTNTFPDANSVMVTLTDTPTDTYYFLENGIYELVLEIDLFAYQNTGSQFSHLDYVTCEVFAAPGNGIYNKTIGGLRIKQIEHNTSASDPNPIITHYEYKSATDSSQSSGVLVSTPIYAYFEIEGPNGSGCQKFVRKAFSNSPLGITQGSHIGYRDVQVYYGINGKSTYQYTTAVQSPDDHLEFNEYGMFTPMRAHDWKRGLLVQSVDYRQDGLNYYKVREVENTYIIGPYPQLEKKLHGIQFKCIENITGLGCNDVASRLYQIVSGWQFLSTTTQRIFDQNNSSQYVETITNFEYANQDHIQMTKSTTTDSDSRVYSTEYKYPEDYSAVTGSHPVAQLKDRFMHNYPVEILKKSNNLVTSGTRFEYQEEHGHIIRRKVHQTETTTPFSYTPSSDASGSGGNYIERVEFVDYDTHGNILEVKSTNGQPISYIWGHDLSLHTCQVVNASTNQIAYTSFDYGIEPDPNNNNKRIDGNWEFMVAGGWSKQDAKTGIGQYDLNSQRTVKTTVGIAGDYILSFWAKQNNPLNISANHVLSRTEPAADGWTLYVYKLTLTANQTLSLSGNNSGSNYIDELRLHPSEAQMTSYSYDEHLRIRTVNDPNNRSVNYYYDGFGRLIQVIDHNGNLRSLTEYNLAPQP